MFHGDRDTEKSIDRESGRPRNAELPERPRSCVRNTRERRRNREIGKLPRIVSSKYTGETRWCLEIRRSVKRQVLKIRQVCVNTRKSSAGAGSIKISKTSSDTVTQV